MAVTLPARAGNRDPLFAAQILSRHRLGAGHDLFRRSGADDTSAVDAGPGADVDDMVRGRHGLFIVFDHDQRVSEVAQAVQRLQQLGIVPLVQADARLVQDVQHAHQLRADLRGQADPLALAAREGPCRARQGQITEAHAVQEVQTAADLLDDLAGDQLFPLGKRQAFQKGCGLLHGKGGQFRDVDAAHGHGQSRLLQTLPSAVGAGGFGHTGFDLCPHGRTLGLTVAAFEIRDDPLKLALDGAVALRPFIVKLKRLALRAVEDGVEGFRRQILDGIGELEAVAFCKCLKVHARNAVGLDIAPSRGVQTAVIDAELFVRDDHLGVDEQLNAEARAGRAGAVGVIEGKEPRRNLLQGDAAVGAGIVLGKAELFPAVLQHRRHQTAGEAEGGLRRVGQAAPRALLDPNPVDDDLDRMLFVLVQGNLFREIIDNSVCPYADIARALRILQDLAVLALFPAHHRRHQRNAGILGQLHQTVDDLVHGLLPDLSAALRAVRNADSCVQQA